MINYSINNTKITVLFSEKDCEWSEEIPWESWQITDPDVNAINIFRYPTKKSINEEKWSWFKYELLPVQRASSLFSSFTLIMPVFIQHCSIMILNIIGVILE